MLTIYFMSQHLLVFRIKTLIEAIALHPFQVFWLDTLTRVSGPVVKDVPQAQQYATWSLFKRVEFFAESVKCHDNTVVFV